MTKYKLNITYTFNDDELESAMKSAQEILRYLPCSDENPDISLTIEGDRSGANYLAPVNEKHYKHGKVPLSEIKLD